jgi:hypothetical protein
MSVQTAAASWRVVGPDSPRTAFSADPPRVAVRCSRSESSRTQQRSGRLQTNTSAETGALIECRLHLVVLLLDMYLAVSHGSPFRGCCRSLHNSVTRTGVSLSGPGRTGPPPGPAGPSQRCSARAAGPGLPPTRPLRHRSGPPTPEQRCDDAHRADEHESSSSAHRVLTPGSTPLTRVAACRS